MQSGIEIGENTITGELKYVEDYAESGPLAGSGYYLALKWSNIDETATSLKVGLVPSQGTGMIECLDDTDRNGVFKITDKDTQKFRIEVTDANGSQTVLEYDLSGLALEEHT